MTEKRDANSLLDMDLDYNERFRILNSVVKKAESEVEEIADPQEKAALAIILDRVKEQVDVSSSKLVEALTMGGAAVLGSVLMEPLFVQMTSQADVRVFLTVCAGLLGAAFSALVMEQVKLSKFEAAVSSAEQSLKQISKEISKTSPDNQRGSSHSFEQQVESTTRTL